MGCSVTKSRGPGAICSQMRTRPTASSSGLQYEGSSSHFLDRNPLVKEKGSILGTSSGNSPDSARGIEFPKVAQKVDENPTIARQRPRDQENQDFSFKANTDSSIEKEREKKLNTSGNQSLFRPMEANSRKKELAVSGYFPNVTSNGNENKTPEKENIVHDITVPILGGMSFACVKGSDNQNVQTPVKSEIDQAGLAFSFMNIRQSNANHQTVFYDEEAEKNAAERVGQYFNLARSSVFGVKPNETEKLTESQKKKTLLMNESSVSSISCQSPAKQNLKAFKDIKDIVTQSSAQGSLSVIDPVEELAKEKSIPISNTLVATSTNIATQRTASSLANLCLDEKKRTAFNRKFTTNLVTLVKPAGALAGIQLNAAKSLSTIQVPLTSNSLKFNTNPKVQSSPNFDLKCNLLSLTKLRHDEDSEDKLQLRREQTEDTKVPNIPDRSIDLSGFEIPGDSGDPSPIAEGSFPNLNKTNTPKTLLFSQGNTSFSRQVDGSTILDKTIYPLEDNITRLDLDRYSINVEMGERETLMGSPQKSTAGGQSRRLNNSFNLLNKAKSAILDTQVNSATMAPQKRNLEHFYSRPKSFCDIEPAQPKDNTSTGDCYLSPHRVPTHKQCRTPQHERSITQDLNRTPPSFIETSRADKSVDNEGQKKINQYLLIKDLGRGGFGKVKLAIHCDTKEQYAIKISNKKRLKKKMLSRSKSAYTLLAKEVAIMKKMDHPNIVRLMEVIDDPNHNNLYIAMEFIKKGAVLSKTYWKHEMIKKQDGSDDEDTSRFKSTKLTEEKAKKYFRHLILALDYLHNTVGIIHRDIKPENLLIAADDTLKISDFGISEIMQGDNDLLDTNAGTKLYLAPEAWKGKSFRGKPADIWAAGGTLYYLLTGRSPFQGFAAEDIKKKILEDELLFPADVEISEGAKDLIRACLRKEPEERITLPDIMNDKWLTDDGTYPLENNPTDDLVLSEEDLNKAITKISFMAVVYVTATLKKAHRAKLNVRRKKTEASLINESQKQL